MISVVFILRPGDRRGWLLDLPVGRRQRPFPWRE